MIEKIRAKLLLLKRFNTDEEFTDKIDDIIGDLEVIEIILSEKNPGILEEKNNDPSTII